MINKVVVIRAILSGLSQLCGYNLQWQEKTYRLLIFPFNLEKNSKPLSRC